MKLLIDRMLSYRLIRYLEPHYPGTEHVDRSHKINAGDNETGTAQGAMDSP